MIRRVDRLVLVLAAATVMAGAASPPAAQPEQVERHGRWAVGEQAEPGTDGARQMAATPAAEDPSVWLMLVCGHSQLTASLMHSAHFPYAVSATSELVWRFENRPAVAAAAHSINDSQLSIDSATTRRLMPLIIDSERAVVSMRDRAGIAHHYTFLLQPNGPALTAVVGHCPSD
jgi:hypothetical protein